MTRNCKCPIWVQDDLVRGWEASGEVGVVKLDVPTVAEAVTKFIDDANARHLAGDTVRKYKNLLKSTNRHRRFHFQRTK